MLGHPAQPVAGGISADDRSLAGLPIDIEQGDGEWVGHMGFLSARFDKLSAHI